MPESRAKLIERKEQFQAVYPQVREELMRIPGVVKIGIGIKETNGVLTDETVFRVYVVEKKPLEALPAGEQIPKEIRGFKTDVVVVSPAAEDDDEDKYRPVTAGIQINRQGGGLGTLGFLAHLVSDNSVVLVSNRHVLYGDNGADGTEIGQPLHKKSCCCTCNEIANNVHAVQSVDCAIARLKSGVGHEARVEEIGAITGVNSVVQGQPVKKRGRTTGLTNGVVSNLDMSPDGLEVVEIEVTRNNGNDRFAYRGDSGAPVLNAADEIVGIHRASSQDSVVAPNLRSFEIPITRVTEALTLDGFQITIITGGGDSAGRLHAAPAGLSDAIWTLERRLNQSGPGRQLWQAVHRHEDELLELVNHRRAVTLVWHRCKGPTYIAALGRSLKEPSYRLPAAIEGVSRDEAARVILSALQTHGSSALRASLELYAPRLGEVFLRHNTVEDMIQAWEEHGAAMVVV
jgi:hypothetical protein